MQQPFTHLQIEQEALMELLTTYDSSSPDSIRSAQVIEICRIGTAVTQVRDEVIDPACVKLLDRKLHFEAMVELDLARVLIYELMNSGPSTLLYDSLVTVLYRLLERRFREEQSLDGLWSRLQKLDLTSVDLCAGERLAELDRLGRQGEWTPLAPEGLETLRSSLPPGAASWKGSQS